MVHAKFIRYTQSFNKLHYDHFFTREPLLSEPWRGIRRGVYWALKPGNRVNRQNGQLFGVRVIAHFHYCALIKPFMDAVVVCKDNKKGTS